MAEAKKKKITRSKTPHLGAKVGKDPTGALSTKLTSSKYRAGGQQVRAKKGGIVRKPVPKIAYKKKK